MSVPPPPYGSPADGPPPPFGSPPPYGPPQYGPPPQYGAPPYGPPPYGPSQYGPPRYGPPPGYPYPNPNPPTSPWAIVSLVFGVIGGILVSVVAGIVALRKTKDGRAGGRSLAIAGLALSAIWTVGLTILVILIANDDSVTASALQEGDCLAELPHAERVVSISRVTCDQPHIGEVFANITIPDGDFPGDPAVQRYAEQCSPALAEWFPAAVHDDSIGLYLLYPTEQTWASGDHTITCVATTQDQRTGPLRGT